MGSSKLSGKPDEMLRGYLVCENTAKLLWKQQWANKPFVKAAVRRAVYCARACVERSSTVLDKNLCR